MSDGRIFPSSTAESIAWVKRSAPSYAWLNLRAVRKWRPQRWHATKLSRVRALADIRLGVPELACLAGAIALLLWSANVEAAGVIAFLQ